MTLKEFLAIAGKTPPESKQGLQHFIGDHDENLGPAYANEHEA